MQDQPRIAPQRLTGSGPAPSIGFLIDWLGNSPYQCQILRRVTKEADDRGAQLLCFVGGAIAPPGKLNPANAVFELARSRNVDCVALLSSSLGNAIGLDGLKLFCEKFRPMPTCSIAVALGPDVSSVRVDNESGMQALVAHMIQVHGIRRIAFVRGPPASDEAELRLRVYRETLAANGIPYAEELVVPGDFNAASGREAVDILFVERKLAVSSVGAIVAANDLMALAAIEELRVRGIRVPDEIAVGGFDDVQQAAFSLPPLTTVRQRLEDMGRESVRLVLEQWIRRSEPEQVVRRTEIVTRRSCGCLPGYAAGRKSSSPPGSTLGFDAAILRRRQHILAELARAARGTMSAAGSEWDVRLLNAISEQVRGDSPNVFLRVYDALLRRLVTAGSDLSVCNDVLSALRSRVVRAISDPKLRMRTEDLFHEARVLTSNAIEGVHVARRLQGWNAALALLDAGASIASASTLDELARAVHRYLPAAGISRCFVLRLHENLDAPTTARVILAEKPEARKSDPTQSTIYLATDVLRDAVLGATTGHAFVVFAAKFANGDPGAVVLELGDVEGQGYEALRVVFSSVIARIPD